MTEKLTIVVTCTDRKSASPPPQLMMRNLGATTDSERYRRWRGALDDAGPVQPLHTLYAGDAWAQARRLEATASRVGFESQLLVASAGLGLRYATDAAPSYAATFALRQPDSVSTNHSGNRSWWNQISDGAPARQALIAPTLLVLSDSYATAMQDDLARLGVRDDVVVFGGSRHVPARARIESERRLIRSLGGTATSLNLRMAAAWLEMLDEPNLSAGRNCMRWQEWVEANRETPMPTRRPMSDLQVLTFLSALLEADPTMTKSRALRLFRDSNYACEQRRFGELFKQAAQI